MRGMSACDTLPMAEAKLDQRVPWSEAEYLALDETASRIELIDGGLWVSPAPISAHQSISLLLQVMLLDGARQAGMRVNGAINVRVRPNRILIPDVAVGTMGRVETVTAARDVALVAEILSPSTAWLDRGLKMQFYAEAKIEWYLLVSPAMPDYDAVELELFHWEDGKYVAAASAGPTETLTTDLPFPIVIPADDLVDF